MMINRRTKNYYLGGIVKVENPTPRERRNVDTQKAILQEGSLVIPKKHVALVNKYLKEKNIDITRGRPTSMNPDRIVNALLVVGELVIPPEHTREVVHFLRSHNIHLPNTNNL